MQGKLSCPFQKQWNKANNGGRCGVFCLPCVLQTLQQLSSAVPTHCTLQARSRSCSAAVLQRWWRCCEGSHHYNIHDFPRLAPPPALHSAGDRVGVESGFCKVAVACLFTGRFAHLLPAFWNIFMIWMSRSGEASLQSRNVVGGWWRLGGGSGCHSDSIIGVITTCTLHISSPTLLTSSNHLSIFCLEEMFTHGHKID